MSDVKIQFETEISDALRGNMELIRGMQQFDESLKSVAKSAGRAKKEGKDAMEATGKAAKDAAGSIGGVLRVTAGAKDEMTAWVKAGGGITGIVAGVKALVEQLNHARSLQKEMLNVAVDIDKEILKLAHLRGDVSDAGLSKARQDVARIGQSSGLTLPVSSRIAFFAESAMGAGTPAAAAAGETIAQFAGASGLTPEEVSMLPKLFSVMKANTRQKQMDVLNQVHIATAASIAETGEFLTPFISTAVGDIERGFSLSESLSRMVAAVETTGSVASAASESERLAEITAGRNEKAMEFLGKQARKRNQNFAAMTDPERLKFAEELYLDFKKSGNLDALKIGLDPKGFSAMRSIFGETGRRKYAEVFPLIEAAPGSGLVESLAGQYGGSLIAEESRKTNESMLRRARTGRMTAAAAMFQDRVADIVDTARAERPTDPAFILEKGLGSLPLVGKYLGSLGTEAVSAGTRKRLIDDLLEGAHERRIDLRESGVIEGPDPVYERIQTLRRKKRLGGSPEFYGELYELTEGFSTFSDRSRAAAEERTIEATNKLTDGIDRLNSTLDRLAAGAIVTEY